jgi:two-component system response regulator YesN
MFNEQLAGIIACGPAVLWDVDEVAVSELTRKIEDMAITVKADQVFKNTPSYECANMTSAAQIFFIMVNNLTREHSLYLQQRAQITEQQAKIASLIIDRNIAAASIVNIEKHMAASSYPVETEKELIAFVQSGNKPRAVFILNNLLSEIFSLSDGNMDTIRVKIFELIAFLSRSAFDAGAPLEDVKTITQSSFEVCSSHTDFERICFLTTQALERFIDTVYQNRRQNPVGEHLTKAIDHIMAHYGEELDLGTVAAAIYVSPHYLSHLFRKEMNTTFSNYLCKVRINRAKEFLKENKNLNIQEVSEKAGFNEPNYFSVIFKKLTGVTPKEYKAFFK